MGFFITGLILILGALGVAVYYLVGKRKAAATNKAQEQAEEKAWAKHEARVKAYNELPAGERRYLDTPREPRFDNRRVDNPAPFWIFVAAGALVLGIISGFASLVYFQDEGEARALRSVTGELVGSDVTPGPGLKAPWVSAIKFDTRNNAASYIGDGNSDFSGGKPTGNQISFTDRDSTAADMDVVVTYSVRPDKVEDIYREYKAQENFRSRLIEQDIRAVVRTVPGKYSTAEVLTQREKVSNDIQAALAKRWADWGVVGVQVAVQEIRYPEVVKERFNNLTAERTRAQEAQAATLTAEETAKKRIVEAKAEAEANRLLDRDLTPAVLENRRIDMLKSVGEKGNLIITDGKSAPLINIDGKK